MAKVIVSITEFNVPQRSNGTIDSFELDVPDYTAEDISGMVRQAISQSMGMFLANDTL